MMLPPESPLIIRNCIDMPMVKVPAGTFMMGTSATEIDAAAKRYHLGDFMVERETPQREVTLIAPFYLGQYPVTQAQWKAVMRTNPSYYRSWLVNTAHRPVEQVSWMQVQAFIQRLNAMEGKPLYRLPTEAEWEYAARAGSCTAYSLGDDSHDLKRYAWYGDTARKATHGVGQLEPNVWGFYDVHGQVWEWVQDWYGEYAAEPVTDPQGPSSGLGRVLRGGSWFSSSGLCRSAMRTHASPDHQESMVGFRLLRVVEPEPSGA